MGVSESWSASRGFQAVKCVEEVTRLSSRSPGWAATGLPA